MFFGRKKHIRILADKFNHSIDFEGNSLILKNDTNLIKLTDTTKNKINIHYNVKSGEENLLVSEFDFIDVLFELLSRRDSQEPIELKEGELMNLQNYIDEVGAHYFLEKIQKIKHAITDGTYRNEILQGNRMEAEVYNKLLILTDDLRYYKTNTIDIEYLLHI